MALTEAHIIPEKNEASSQSPFAVKNVLFAADFSPTSEAAFPYAAAICRRFSGTLHLAHVLSDAGLIMMTGGVDYVSMGTLYEDANAEAKEKLEEIASHLENVAHYCYVRHGQVWMNLAEIVSANHIDLIVVGTHGRTGLGKLLLGSIAEGILRHAPCPVLTVGPRVSQHDRLPAFHDSHRDLAPAELGLQKILFATNFAANASGAAKIAAGIAAEFRAQLTLMHVIEDYNHLGSRPQPIESDLRRLHELLPEDIALQYAPEYVIEFGSASDRILKVAGDREEDLIVLGARPASEPGTTHLPWSTAYEVMARARCPVLTLRG
ncbi:MAG TPA: universal stress protein [Verrucomicrobiae bacterium]|nr:universal stress protein [Verrucomicrobiae bacterium]